ncbi:MAG: Uma2 family endonuclease [Roseiflexaceae bacterium]
MSAPATVDEPMVAALPDAAESPAVVTPEPAPLRMSYEEWLAWEHEGGLSEWVDGEVIIHMAPQDEHQRVVEFLDRLLGLFVHMLQLGMVRVAPFAMRAMPGGPAREPDLFFLAAERMSLLQRRELAGPADLAIEIISDDSVARDRADKFYEYQRGGVREYWIIDPRPGQQRVDVYTLDARGRYQPIPAVEGAYHSSVLAGFWLREDWLWVERPDPLAALAEVVGVERVIGALREGTGVEGK